MIYLVFVVVAIVLYVDYFVWSIFGGIGGSFLYMWKKRMAPLFYSFNFNRYQSRFINKYADISFPNSSKDIPTQLSSTPLPIVEANPYLNRNIKYHIIKDNHDSITWKSDLEYATICLFFKNKVVNIYYLNKGKIETSFIAIANIKNPHHHFYSPYLLQRQYNYGITILDYIHEYDNATLFDGDIETLVNIFIATFKNKTSPEYNLLDSKNRLINVIQEILNEKG